MIACRCKTESITRSIGRFITYLNLILLICIVWYMGIFRLWCNNWLHVVARIDHEEYWEVEDVFLLFKFLFNFYKFTRFVIVFVMLNIPHVKINMFNKSRKIFIKLKVNICLIDLGWFYNFENCIFIYRMFNNLKGGFLYSWMLLFDRIRMIERWKLGKKMFLGRRNWKGICSRVYMLL